MPFPGLTRLSPAQILTDTIWNELMDLLEAKFTGAVGAGDITWPLLAEGDIDFGQTYGILGLRSLWGIINAGEYPSLNAAVAAAPSGGTVFVPPGHTRLEGPITISASDVAIIGAGPDSVVHITASSTGPLFDIASTGLSDITFANLVLDGTGSGAGCIGIRARRVTRLHLHNVYMAGFTGDFIVLTNDGVAGNACTDAQLTNVYCTGGGASHLFADDVSGLYVSNFTGKSATGDIIDIVPASSSHLAQDIRISDAALSVAGAKGIRIIGSGASPIAAHSRIQLDNCRVTSSTGLPFELGNTSTILMDVIVNGCMATGALGDALRIAASRGVVTACHLQGAGGKGINMQNSSDLYVYGNQCQDATGDGIDADSTTDCTIVQNNVRDCGASISRVTATGLRLHNNVGDVASTVGTVYTDTSSDAVGAASGTFAQTYTVPANTLKEGDRLRITIAVTSNGTTDGVNIQLGGNTVIASGALTTVLTSITADIVVRQTPSTTAGLATLVRNAGTVAVLTGAPTGIDLTADMAVTITKGGTTDTVTMSRFYVEFLGSE